MYTFVIVPNSFMGGGIQGCSIPNPSLKNRPNKGVMGCYCIESNDKCRKILLFLKHFGRFRAMAVANILHREIKQAFEYPFANSFDEMIEKIVYPAFLRRFRERYESRPVQLQNQSSEAPSIKILQSCLEDGPDCIVALNTMNDLLYKVYRIFHIMNKDIRPSLNSSLIARDRHKGSLVANLNFLLTEDLSNSKHPTAALSQLHRDLEKLGRLVTPAETLTLPEFLHLLGYTQNLGLMKYVEESKDLELSSLSHNTESCHMDQFHLSWHEYLNDISNQLEGNIIVYLHFLIHQNKKIYQQSIIVDLLYHYLI